MIRFLGLRTVRGRVRFLSFLLITLPILAAVVLFGLVLKGRIEDQERRRLERSAEQHAALIESWMDRRLADIRYLATMEATRALDLPRMESNLAAFGATHEEFAGVVYVGPEGRTVIDTTAPAGVDLSDRAYFRAAQEGTSYVSDLLIGRTSGAAILVFSAPVMGRSGRFEGLIFGPVRVGFMESVVSLLAPSPDGRVYLLNRSGQFIVGRDDPTKAQELPRPLTELYSAALREGRVPTRYVNYRGESVVGAAQPLKGGQWVLFVETRQQGVHSSQLAFLGIMSLAGLSVILLLTPALIGLARSIERPLEEMVRAAREIEEGHYGVSCGLEIVRNSPQEIQSLYTSFCTMAGKLQETVTRLEETSITDALTSLPNRRYLMAEGVRLTGLCQRGDSPCSVLMIDLDRFKQVNDGLGHMAGDRVLAHVAGLIRGAARASDLVARYGGEEFVILAPNANLEQAGLLAERIRATVESRTCSLDSQTLLCTVSVGTAQVDYAHKDMRRAFEDALQRADTALYAAKKNGRNRVERAS